MQMRAVLESRAKLQDVQKHVEDVQTKIYAVLLKFPLMLTKVVLESKVRMLEKLNNVTAVLIRAYVTQRAMYPKMQTKAALVSKVRMLENQRPVMVVLIRTFVQVGRQRRKIQTLMRLESGFLM